MQNPSRNERLTGALHALTLASFAFAQPLFGLLGKQAGFFVAQRSEPVDVFIFTFAAAFLVPGIAAMASWASGFGGRRLWPGVHGTLIWLLCALIIQPPMKHVFRWHIPFDASAGVQIFATLAAAVIPACLYRRFVFARSFVTMLSPAILVFPAVFLFGSQVRNVAFPARPAQFAQAKLGSDAPLVVLIFDELPLTSLLREGGKIDASRFPHFAALAEGATLFRNATTVGLETFQAVPAILTGRYPRPGLLGDLSGHPENLLTWLGASRELLVYESATHLAPDNAKGKRLRSFWERIKALAGDTAVIYRHIVYPRTWAARLPDISRTWTDFGRRGAGRRRSLAAEQVERFRNFVSRIEKTDGPAFYFGHVNFPHMPWTFYPSGRTYASGAKVFPHGLIGERSDVWRESESETLEAYRRHLLQVGFADKLLGEFVAKLKKEGIYDSAVLIVTADHGVSFRPGQPSRNLGDNIQDIALVPLLVKKPGQVRGEVSDRGIESVDILPSLASLLKGEIPWAVEGRPWTGGGEEKRERTLVKKDGERVVLPENIWREKKTIARKIKAFGRAPGWRGVFTWGPFAEYRGKPAASYIDSDKAQGRVSLESGGRGYLKGRLSAMPDSTVVAAVSGGRLLAFSQAYPGENAPEFEILISESDLDSTPWPPEVFEADIAGGKLRLRAFGAFHFKIDSDEELISGPDGRTYRIEEGAYAGRLDEPSAQGDILFVSGWAADPKRGVIPPTIVLFQEGRSVRIQEAKEFRDEMQRLYKNGHKIWKSGFVIETDLETRRGLSDKTARVFALGADGIASELFPGGARASR
jgi:hypothetical protein